MTCKIQHLHFDCDGPHPLGYTTIRLVTTPIPIPEHLSPVEQLLWQFPPPWHHAIKNCSGEHRCATWGKIRQPSFGRVLVLFQASSTIRNTVWAFSDMLVDGESYQESLGSIPFRPKCVIPIPNDMQAPLLQDEEKWLNQRWTRFPRSSPYRLTTTTRSLFPVFLGLLHDTKSPDTALSRLARNAIYDPNIWSIVKSLTLPIACNKSQLVLSRVRTCKDLPAARTVDGQHLVFYKGENTFLPPVELATFTVMHREILTARFTVRRPLRRDHPGVLACMNSKFIALVFFERKVVITTLTGELVSSFNVSPNIFFEVLTLHPHLPFIVFLGLHRFHILDFDGRSVSQSPHSFDQGFALQAFFDAASESILVDTTSGIIIAPLLGYGSFKARGPPAADKVGSHFNEYHYEQDCTDLYTFQWVKPVAAKRKSPCD